MWPHRWQPTRLPRSWNSPGKNPGMGCHFLLQCMKVKSESEVAQNKMVGGVKSRLESNPKPTRHLEGSNKTLSAPGPRDPTRDWGRSAFECLSVSWGMGQLWPAMGTGALATADLGGVVCGISPFEGGSHCHHYPIKEETQPHPLTENWIKDYWTLPIKARPRFPHSQSLPSGASGTFYPYLSEDRQNENHNNRKLTELIT